MVDEKDKRILFELDRNSRQSLVKVAKITRIPYETVRHRVQKLIESGVIQNFLAVIDGGKLGFYYYKIFFRFRNATETIVDTIIHFLHSEPTVTWIIRVDGTFDLGFTVNVKNPIELSVLIDKIRSRFSVSIHQWTYSVNIRMEFLTRDYLLEQQRKPSKAGKYMAYTKPYELDRINWKIIRRLAESSRLTAKEIASGLPLTDDAVAMRIKQMERDEVIVRYNLVLDNSKLTQLNYYILVYLNSVAPEKEEAFVEYCKSRGSIVYIIKALGEWDYEINVEVRSIEEYRVLMMDLTKKFSSIIRDYNGLVVSKIHKYIYP